MSSGFADLQGLVGVLVWGACCVCLERWGFDFCGRCYGSPLVEPSGSIGGFTLSTGLTTLQKCSFMVEGLRL